MNKRDIGSEREEQACSFLLKENVQILDKNYHFHRMGEIDIIGKDGDYLVFFEVKYRKDDSKGSASMAVNFTKQRQISKTALGYITQKRLSLNTPFRFDVIAIDGVKIEWIKNAFNFVG